MFEPQSELDSEEELVNICFLIHRGKKRRRRRRSGRRNRRKKMRRRRRRKIIQRG